MLYLRFFAADNYFSHAFSKMRLTQITHYLYQITNYHCIVFSFQRAALDFKNALSWIEFI